MLIDANNPRYISMNEEEGIVIAIDVHEDWELERLNRIEQGKEGVFYATDDKFEYGPLTPIETEMEDQSVGRALFRLKPDLKSTRWKSWIHRYLIRYWDTNMYVPYISSFVLQLQEFHQEDGDPIWQICTPDWTLHGVKI